MTPPQRLTVTRRGALALFALPVAAGSAEAKPRYTAGQTKTMWASWYMHGQRTANGERFNPRGLTMAHRTMPMGTLVRLYNPVTGAATTVRVNDRGPHVRGRDCDVSLGVAEALGMKRAGVTALTATILSVPA